MAPNALPAGLSGTVLNALRPGLSEPTNDNEIFREEKNAAKKEDNRSGCACASPPPEAPASAAATPSPRPSGETSNEQELTSGEVSSDKSSESSSSTSSAAASGSVASLSTSSRSAASRPSAGSRPRSSSSRKPKPEDDPIDPHYGIPVSYVKRYEAHADELNEYIKRYPEVAEDIENASDKDAGRLIMHLLDVLDIG
jgi:hypothetical protein